MAFDPKKHHRRSIRLEAYDYAEEGAYFVTVCTQDEGDVFGVLVEDEMRLNGAGAMAQAVWDELPAHYPGVETDAFIVMPNHIHGIIILQHPPPVGAAPRGRPNPDNVAAPRGHADTNAPPHVRPGTATTGQPPGGASTLLSLPDVVHRYKSLSTKRYADGVRTRGWPRFPGRLWQRNYYERIIRDEDELNALREYIHTNPARWTEEHG